MMLPNKDGSLTRGPHETNNFFFFQRKEDKGMDNFLDMGLKNYSILKDITNKRLVNPIVDGFWKLYFDGACSKNGSRIGVIIEILNSKMKPHAYKFAFEFKNNEVEYEIYPRVRIRKIYEY